MKLSIAAAAVLGATSAFAQISIITKTLANVSDSILDLDKAVTSFNIDQIQARADALIAAITTGKNAVNASKVITLADSLGLNGPVQNQNKEFETLVSHLMAKRSDVEKANACTVVHSRISSINTASLGLIEAIIAKVPQAAQSIVRQVATETTRTLNEGQYDFSAGSCKNVTPTPTTSATTASATSSPTATDNSADSGGSKKAPVGGIVGGVLGGLAALGIAGVAIFLFLRRKKQKLQEERENAVELDTERNPPAPLEKDYKELCAQETERRELSATDTEKKEMDAVSSAIHEAPNNERYELE